LCGGDVDLQLGVLETEQGFTASSVSELMAVARLDLMELGGAALHRRSSGKHRTAK
jgi:hypothetical protein